MQKDHVCIERNGMWTKAGRYNLIVISTLDLGVRRVVVGELKSPDARLELP
jgi:hypothetical protein